MSSFTKAAIASAFVLASLGAQAQSFSGADGTTSASATFVSGAGYFDVTLWNTQTGADQGAGNELTGISFDTTADLTGAAQSLYQAGDLIELTGPATKVGLADPAVNAAGFGWAWGALNYLSALPGSVGENGPDLGIINAAATSFGASLAGNGAHNPLYQSVTAGAGVTFRVWDSDVNVDTLFSDVVFRFNTDGLTTVPGPCLADCEPTTPVPEPETYALMLAGLAAVGFMARRRRERN